MSQLVNSVHDVFFWCLFETFTSWKIEGIRGFSKFSLVQLNQKPSNDKNTPWIQTQHLWNLISLRYPFSHTTIIKGHLYAAQWRVQGRTKDSTPLSTISFIFMQFSANKTAIWYVGTLTCGVGTPVLEILDMLQALASRVSSKNTRSSGIEKPQVIKLKLSLNLHAGIANDTWKQ